MKPIKGFSFGNKFSIFEKIEDTNPGVGSYNVVKSYKNTVGEKNGLKFSQKTRFSLNKFDQFPGPGTYQTTPTEAIDLEKNKLFHSTSNTTISQANRQPLFSQIKNSPTGPGQYNIKGEFDIINQKGAMQFQCYSSRDMYSQRNQHGPPVGTYTLPPVKSPVSYSIGSCRKSQSMHDLLSSGLMPGPGQYNIQQIEIKDKKVKNGLSFSKSPRFQSKIINAHFPGPNYYQTEENLSNSMRRNISKPYSFARSSKEKALTLDQAYLPSPQDYVINATSFEKGITLPRSQRPDIANLNKTPGVGAYQLPDPLKNNNIMRLINARSEKQLKKISQSLDYSQISKVSKGNSSLYHKTDMSSQYFKKSRLKRKQYSVDDEQLQQYKKSEQFFKEKKLIKLKSEHAFLKDLEEKQIIEMINKKLTLNDIRQKCLPGPGQYDNNLKAVIPEKKIVFQKAERKDEFLDVFNQCQKFPRSPGPGIYEVLVNKTKDTGQSFTTDKKESTIFKPKAGPGVGSYSMRSQFDKYKLKKKKKIQEEKIKITQATFEFDDNL